MNPSPRPDSRLALLLMVAGLLSFTACRSSRTSHVPLPPTTTILLGGPRAEAPEPVPAPAPRPQPAVAQVGNQLEMRSDLLHLIVRAPATASIGQTVECQMILTALNSAANIVLTDFVSPNATVIRTEPPASITGHKLTWTIDKMAKGEVRTFRVWLRADDEGALMNCAAFIAQPIGCVVTTIGRPMLSIEKTGPATAKIGEQVTYNFIVRNTGSSPAEGVVVSDMVPDGMSHSSGLRVVSFDPVNLGPGEGRQGTVSFRVDQRGRFTNSVSARSGNAGAVYAQAVTAVIQQQIAVLKTGPREQFIGKNADYLIVVSNPGDTVLNGVTVTDSAPAGTSIVSAQGASVSGDTARWSLPQLRPGERVGFNISLRGNQAGTTVNGVTAGSSEGLIANSSAETLWRGFAAILLEMVDDPDPLQIGEMTTYTIRVTNQGTAPDSNISLTVNFPENISPVNAAGVTGGFVRGRSVQFEALPILNAKQVATWTIRARATAVGDGRVRAELRTTLLKSTPVVKDEATQVF